MSTTLRVAHHATKYTCAACRIHTSSFSTRASSQAVLDTEKWRKKIWGTDKPPGAKDPYGGPSAAEMYAAERQGKKIGKPKVPKAKAVKLEQFDMSTYQESDSWEGLEEVGGKGIWWMNREEPEFKGFMPWMKVEDPYEVTAALHRAVVEVFALRAANKPLEMLNAASIGPDVTSEVQIVSGPEGARLALPEHMELSDITGSFSQVFDETAVKTNPSMAEAEVAADRSAAKPQSDNNPVEMVDETEVKVAPSLAEEEVAADRSNVDPMRDAAYRAMVESWDPAWLNISLKDPALKFAVSQFRTSSTVAPLLTYSRSSSAACSSPASASPTQISTTLPPSWTSSATWPPHPRHAS